MDETVESYNLTWVENRLRALEQMEADLLEMRALAETARDHILDKIQLDILNRRIEFLRQRVNRIDENTRVPALSKSEIV